MSRIYSLGHFIWNGEQYALPEGALGCIDLAPPVIQGIQASTRPIAMFVSTTQLSSDYYHIGNGDLRELQLHAVDRDAFQSLMGYRPQGDTLMAGLVDILTEGSDPSGEDGPKPLMPTTRGYLDIHLPGHSLVYQEAFTWGHSRRTNKIKSLLQKDFERTFNLAMEGKLKDREHHLRCLDYLCEKYHLSDWREVVPAKLVKEIPGRKRHETIIVDDFTLADGTVIGNQLTWTEVNGNWTTVSNAARGGTSNNRASARAEHDLSSADHYAQLAFISSTGVNARIAYNCVRFDPSAEIYYRSTAREDGGNANIAKMISGTATTIATLSSVTISLPDTLRTEINGSTIEQFFNGVSNGAGTDTAITGNLRCGIGTNTGGSSTVTVDDFEAGDLTTFVYTQLERGTRGIGRGICRGLSR